MKLFSIYKTHVEAEIYTRTVKSKSLQCSIDEFTTAHGSRDSHKASLHAIYKYKPGNIRKILTTMNMQRKILLTLKKYDTVKIREKIIVIEVP